MADDLKIQIENLVKFQELDSQIYALQNELIAKPIELKALEEVFLEKKQGLAALEKTNLDLQKQRKERELELAAAEEGIKKLQGQLFSLKTNKEFQTMQQEIDGKKADTSVIEEKILILFDEADKLRKEVEQENLKLKNEEKVFNDEKAKLDLRVKEVNDRLVQLESARKQLLPSLDAKILANYERILHSREGLALAVVKNNSCSGCHMLVSAQVENLIKMYDKLITCETCNRILYIP